MTRKPDLFPKFPTDDSDSDTPEKCRKRRRRRIEMRRMRIASAQLFSSQFQPPICPPETRPEIIPNFVPTRKQYLVEQETLPKLLQPPSSSHVGLVKLTPSVVENPMPGFGCISIQGLSESMNDAWFVKENFCAPDIVGGKPLHFFAVYDGHGRSDVSRVWKRMMHRVLVEELMARVPTSKTFSVGDANSAEQKEQNDEEVDDEEEEWENSIRVVLERSFQRMDELAVSTCAYGCHCQVLQQHMDVAFAGSTALVALLTPHRIVVANCGDARAVLCRDGRPILLSSLDHKAERPDELHRTRAASGKIAYQNGVRVYGILNMSRSLAAAGGGDNVYLKRVVTSSRRPEISITEREAEDECLILGSNGIWDVMSDEMACEVASGCLKHGSPNNPRSGSSRHYNPPGPGRRHDDRCQVLFPSKSKFAATILCRLALGRGSQDNISVIVVDLTSKTHKLKAIKPIK